MTTLLRAALSVTSGAGGRRLSAAKGLGPPPAPRRSRARRRRATTRRRARKSSAGVHILLSAVSLWRRRSARADPGGAGLAPGTGRWCGALGAASGHREPPPSSTRFDFPTPPSATRARGLLGVVVLAEPRPERAGPARTTAPGVQGGCACALRGEALGPLPVGPVGRDGAAREA